MKFHKIGDNLTEVTGEKEIHTIEDMIRSMVYLYQGMLLSREDWLTERETDFYIATVLIAHKGIGYTAPEATQIYRRVFNLRRQSDIRQYLRRLEDKYWLRSNKEDKTIQVLSFFDYNNIKNIKLSLDVQYTFKND